MVAVGSHSRVVERHLQLIHGFQQQTLGLIVKVFKRGLLVKERKEKTMLIGAVLKKKIVSEKQRLFLRCLTLVTRSEWRMMARTKKR